MRRIFKSVLIAGTVLLAASMFLYYGHKKVQADARRKLTVQKTGAYYLGLESFADFVALQGAPLSDKFNDVLSVKLVYELRTEQLYFVNSPKYRYHFDFCTKVLNDDDPLYAFNTRNYGSGPERQYLLANLNHYRQSGVYALEFTSDDRISAIQINLLYHSVATRTYLADSLHLLISSDYLSGLSAAGSLDVRKILPGDIYKGQVYQPLTTGVTYGLLKKVADLSASFADVGEQDIIIVRGTPVNVPSCAGIITDMYQTPLSHINVLCHNRGMPSAVQRDIWSRPELDALINKPVSLTVNGDSLHITPATLADLAAFRKRQTARPVIRLKYDLSVTRLLPVKSFDQHDKNAIGNKAAGLGVLAKIARKPRNEFSVPEGAFAIPFYCYNQHISTPAIRSEIDALLADPSINKNPAKLKEQLKLIRKAIKDAPLDARLLQDVRAIMLAGNAGKSYRFRSSSNAEDMPGFSGAGLYESKTGILDDADKPVDEAIKKVWASAWNDEAYLEREAYHIDERSMMMGILCHRNFPNERANGVAITKNLYRKGFPGFTINVQRGEVSVVSPPDSVVCEQAVYMPAGEINPMNAEVSIDYLTYSNINGGKPVLSGSQAAMLVHALSAIKSHYYYNLSSAGDPEYNDYGLDIEFKFDNDGTLYIKQVRPYR